MIVSYRCGPLVRECLQSLREHAPPGGLRVTVVDNASGDGTADVVQSEFPDVRLIALSENVGFSAANNLVLRDTRAEYVLVLNPDTQVREGTLDTLLRRWPSPRIGIVGCRLVQEDGSFDHAARRSFPTPASALGHFLRLGRSEHAPARSPRIALPTSSDGPVDAVNGAFMLIRRSTLDEIGLLTRATGCTWRTSTSVTGRAGRLDHVVRAVRRGLHIKAGTSGHHRRLRLNYAFHYGMYRFYRAHLASQRGSLFNSSSTSASR